LDQEDRIYCLEKRLRSIETSMAVQEEKQETIEVTLTSLLLSVGQHNRVIYIGLGVVITLQALGLIGKF